MRATIKTIAEVSGVSKSTVARALNHEPGVSPEVRENVLKVAKEMHYKANTIGKALRSSKEDICFAILIHKNSFTDVVREGMSVACKGLTDYGVKLKHFYYNKMDYVEQQELLRSLPLNTISGVILKPIDHPSIRSEINRLVEKGIPVITVISDIESSKRLCYVGQELEKGGRIAGNMMGLLLGGKGNVIIFKEIDEGANAFLNRYNGVVSELTDCFPQILIQKTFSIQENDVQNYELAKDYIASNQNVDGIIVIGSSHEDIAQAVQDCRREHQIKIVCFDVFEKTRALMAAGAIDIVITQSPLTQGEVAVKTLFDFVFLGKHPKQSKLYVPSRIENLRTLSK